MKKTIHQLLICMTILFINIYCAYSQDFNPADRMDMEMASEAYEKGNYADALTMYKELLNKFPNNSNFKSQISKCEEKLNPPKKAEASPAQTNTKPSSTQNKNRATTLSLDTYNVSFHQEGGSKKVSVFTNAGNFSVNSTATWCTVSKNNGYFLIYCHTNPNKKERTCFVDVSSGSKLQRISVSQSETKSVTTTTVSGEILSFTQSGGIQKIFITTPGQYDLNMVPSWCQTTKYPGYILVSCSYNYGAYRSDHFYIRAEDKLVKIRINQYGTQKSRSSASQYRSSTTTKSSSCFNCPKYRRDWGISASYMTDRYDYSGILMGVKYEPLFKYGFGINTGLYGVYNYLDISSDYYEMGLYMPVHFEYRIHITKDFSVFAYGGIGLSGLMIVDDDDEEYPEAQFDCFTEYGCGIRFDHFQINYGISKKSSEMNRTMVSIAYMF